MLLGSGGGDDICCYDIEINDNEIAVIDIHLDLNVDCTGLQDSEESDDCSHHRRR